MKAVSRSSKSITLILRTVPLLLAALIGAGCDGGPKKSLTGPKTVRQFQQATVLTGQVSGKAGVVKTGRVLAAAEDGRRIAEAVLAEGHYRLEIPAQTALPVLLSLQSAEGGETLVAVVMDADIGHYDLSPLTTAIAQKAKALGGYTRANMVMAAEGMVHMPDANKTTTGFRGDPTTQYGGWH